MSALDRHWYTSTCGKVMAAVAIITHLLRWKIKIKLSALSLMYMFKDECYITTLPVNMKFE
jgi:hypothetical protein